MDLPDAVLAFKLLDNANLDIQSKKLALKACQDIKFAAMKSALTRIFHDRSMSNDSPSTSLAIKQEVMFTNSRRPWNRGNFNRGSVRGRTNFSGQLNTFRGRGYMHSYRGQPKGKIQL